MVLPKYLHRNFPDVKSSGYKLVSMRSQVELQFWQDVFLAALKNPKVVELMSEASRVNHRFVVDQLAELADQSIKELRQRTSKREDAVYFEKELPK